MVCLHCRVFFLHLIFIHNNFFSISSTSFLTYLSVFLVQPALSSVQFHLPALQSWNCRNKKKQKAKIKNYLHASSPCQLKLSSPNCLQYLRLHLLFSTTWTVLKNLNIMKCLLITIQVAQNFPRFRWVTRTNLSVHATTEAKGGMLPYKGYIGIHVWPQTVIVF